MKITEAAGVGQGTFYLYFASKKEIFDELVLDLNRRVRHAMTEAADAGHDARRAGAARLRAPSSASPPSTRRSTGSSARPSSSRPRRCSCHYERLDERLRRRAASRRWRRARSRAGDPEVLAWALMGIGELVGMRWILWDGERRAMPEHVFDELGADHRAGDRRGGRRP